jgi:photosystem II stability/assembly factor-like uncharacterized protein
LTLGAYAVVVDPQNPGSVYAFTGKDVFKSTDGARRWNSISWNIPGNWGYYGIAINPRDSRIIYAARDGTLFKTIDGGSNWSTANIGLRTGDPVKLVFDPQNPNTVFAVMTFRVEFSAGVFNSELFKSTDGGTSWNSVGPKLPSTIIDAFAMNPHKPNNLYVRIRCCDWFRSTDGGSSWTVLPTTRGFTDLAFDSRDADIVYAAGCGFHKSTDAGTSWTRISDVEVCAHKLVVDSQNPDTLYASTYDSLFKTTNGGVSWNVESGISGGYVAGLAMESNTGRLYVATNAAGVFSIFDSSETTRVPSLAIDSTDYCIGKSWSLSINGAQPDSAIHLLGNSNGQAWEINSWRKTDGNGSHEEKGSFVEGTEGRHMLYVDVEGASSNDVSFQISDCSRASDHDELYDPSR